mmetsp:Transcript_26793/g.57091  ORF Transcript_26793/g.57091 Transcript_26793/m.57091 type:complete len:238 (+) Transcript_26793:2073-2786(+)
MPRRTMTPAARGTKGDSSDSCGRNAVSSSTPSKGMAIASFGPFPCRCTETKTCTGRRGSGYWISWRGRKITFEISWWRTTTRRKTTTTTTTTARIVSGETNAIPTTNATPTTTTAEKHSSNTSPENAKTACTATTQKYKRPPNSTIAPSKYTSLPVERPSSNPSTSSTTNIETTPTRPYASVTTTEITTTPSSIRISPRRGWGWVCRGWSRGWRIGCRWRRRRGRARGARWRWRRRG